MLSTRFTIFLLSLLSLNSALGKTLSDEWVEGKLQELEVAFQQANCQQYFAHGYKFEHMYYLGGVGLDNTVVKKENGKLKDFDIHIAIKGERDGIILLSPVAWPGEDLVFEIVIGVESNTHSVVRTTMDSGNYVTKVSTPGILTPTKFKKFYINFSNDVLKVGVEGEDPFLTYTDVRMREIKYFDVTTYEGANTRFLYDCPPPSFEWK